MLTVLWAKTQEITCEYAEAPAVLLEKRIYPDDYPFAGDGSYYRVEAQKCSLATQCAAAGLLCRWATGQEQSPNPFQVSSS